MAKIAIKCSHCGSEQFKFPTNPKPDDVVACAKCGRTGKYSDIQHAAMEKGKQAIADQLRDAIKKAGFK
jgi:hypothetical protein